MINDSEGVAEHFNWDVITISAELTAVLVLYTVQCTLHIRCTMYTVQAREYILKSLCIYQDLHYQDLRVENEYARVHQVN